MVNQEITTIWNAFHFFDISFQQLNLVSFMIGVLYGATRGWSGGQSGAVRALLLVVIYLISLVAWYWGMYYFKAH